MTDTSDTTPATFPTPPNPNSALTNDPNVAAQTQADAANRQASGDPTPPVTDAPPPTVRPTDASGDPKGDPTTNNVTDAGTPENGNVDNTSAAVADNDHDQFGNPVAHPPTQEGHN